MCGISGKVNFDKEKKIDSSCLYEMSRAMRHRGPDDEGFYINNNVGLGFQRLSIIDLQTGHQPLCNEDESIWIVFNGEIYNFLELRENLQKQGHIFHSKTDTETIVHLYEQYGVDCLQYLRGMFAFAIWDNKKKLLFCARDRFGIKPLYFSVSDSVFAFGSEIKAVLLSGIINKGLDFSALDSYFTYGYITSNKSIYTSIKKLPPAHYLTLDLSNQPKIEINKYWSIKFEPNYTKTEKEWEEELEEVFSETVKLHMISDVPIGAFLSGGIDSSSVVAEMSKHSNVPVQTFSIGFKENDFNELPFANEIASKYGCDHHELIVEPESISLLSKLVSAYDEPFADSSAIPTYFVSKLASENVKVVLSGDGGDELFAGYTSYSKMKLINNYTINWPKLQRLFWGNIHDFFPDSFYGKKLSYFLSKEKSVLGAYFCIWTREERGKLYNIDSLINLKDDYIESFKEHILLQNPDVDYTSNNQQLDMQTYMVDDILTKVDRASMLNSLEVRIPFLDHKFAEFSFTIPSSLKLKKLHQKYILKKTMAPMLTNNIINHPKQGFAIPFSWFTNNLHSYINETLLTNNNLIYNYVDKKYIQQIISGNQKDEYGFSSKIWSLLVFNEWLNQNKNSI